jgi:hypothetical protein
MRTNFFVAVIFFLPTLGLYAMSASMEAGTLGKMAPIMTTTGPSATVSGSGVAGLSSTLSAAAVSSFGVAAAAVNLRDERDIAGINVHEFLAGMEGACHEKNNEFFAEFCGTLKGFFMKPKNEDHSDKKKKFRKKKDQKTDTEAALPAEPLPQVDAN